MLRGFLALLGLFAFFVILCGISLLYEWIRRKTHKTKIGFENFNAKMIKRGDYVCINGRALRFVHWARGGEVIDPVKLPTDDNFAIGGDMVFEGSGLNYITYHPNSLKKCDFIYGKYGVKWAISDYWALRAQEKIQTDLYS